MKKSLLTIVCVIGLLENNSYARIGETLAQCEVRYGSRITDSKLIDGYNIWLYRADDDSLIHKRYIYFKVAPYVVCLTLNNNICDSIRYLKIQGEESVAFQTKKLTQFEIVSFLNSNQNNEKWNIINNIEYPPKNDDEKTIWFSSKTGRLAIADKYILIIKTSDYITRREIDMGLRDNEINAYEKSVIEKL